jgi:hypothetical protein
MRRTACIATLAWMGFACCGTSNQPVQETAHDDGARTATIALPDRGTTGFDAAASIVELAHERMTQAYDILAAHECCITYANDQGSMDGDKRPPGFDRGVRISPHFGDWVLWEPSREDYDFLGVDVDLSPDQRSIVVTSRFGYVPGLLRVTEWIREKLKS